MSKFESDSVFGAIKRYLKKNPTIHKKYKGIYQLNVKLDTKQANWLIDFTTKEAIVRKRKGSKSHITVEIEDLYLKQLYDKKLLLKELKIQERIKFHGENSYESKFMEFMSQFLVR